MANTSYNDIQNLQEDWQLDQRNGLPYSGESVQKFIKNYCKIADDNRVNKAGAFYFDTVNMRFYFFRNEEDKEQFLLTGDNSLVLAQQDIIFSGTQKRLSIINKMQGTTLYFTTNSNSAEITVGFKSEEKELTATDWDPVVEDAYFTVSVDKGSTGNYINILEDRLVRYGETLTFDVFNYLSSGSNRVKVSAVGAISEQTANIGYSVTLTSMYLSPANFGWYTPFIEGNPYNLGGMNIGGALNKKLVIRVTNESGYREQYEENIGTATYVTNPYYYTKLPFPSGGTGIYNVDLWLDAEGVQSEHLNYNMMFVAQKDINTAKLCCISNALDKVINYSDNTLFSYAVYNGGATTASPKITLKSIINTNPTVILDEYLYDVSTSTELQYKINLEIETDETNVKLDSQLTFGVEQRVIYTVDNSNSYPAIGGAIFYVNAANRNNAQSNKEDIINEATKETVSTEWTNMSWVSDGWTTDDTGRKCLSLPARTKANLSYTPFSSLGQGKTLEITFKVKNASDSDENIITICDEPDSPTFRGVRIRPNNILVHSRDLNTDDANQSYDIPEDTLINMQVSIIRDYKVNYGNLCIIYVNGVRKKEFSYSTADSWITQANIILGSQTADLYIYNIRVYSKGFGTQDALQNFIASLPTSTDKRAAFELIDSVIDDSYNVNYEKTKNAANVVTIEMLNGSELPHYGLSKDYSAKCNLSVFWNKHPEWNWSIDNIPVEGQGTTSMNYFRWNLRWRLDKSSGYTIHLADGTTSQENALWFDGENNHPKVSRMTAKINYASSMQSHKIGATGVYNDVHEHLGLNNEVNGRVAVYQEPFYFFEKTLIEGSDSQYTYKFIGLFTFGADKGDKVTFGYKEPEVKDNLLVLEGLDHPIKSVGMDYPWSELKYVADEESLCVDKGADNYDAAWEVSQSGSAESEEEIQAKLDAEFKPAYEVAYNNSTMIIGTDETLETINADVDAWGQRTDENGNAYQRYEFWIDGEYELYYLSKKTNKYVKNGVNLLTQLGLSTEDLSGLDIKAKNELFKSKRREKFKAEMQNYWDLDDCLYCLCMLLLLGATDNFKKNSYPYKLNTLASGSRWRWRQDDLDTLFDIDNQGLAVKGYSIEMHDWTDANKTAYVFKGEDSVFWTLLNECFEVEEKAMGKKILQAMYEMSDTGTTTIDRLMGFFNKYFWNKAQNYFTKSAYNADAEFKYEEAWPKYTSGEYDVDVHPLAQSLGDHLEAEMLWVRQRLIYMMSKWGFGPFAQYTDSCLGRINFRTQLAQSFKLTPFMDMYPCILSGQGAVHASPNRVLSGEEVTIAGAGGTNTNVYIMAADELESIGDLSTLTVDAAGNAGITIASKRLKEIKVGDEVAEKVTSNLQQLNIGQCDSLIKVDARNLKALTGTVDLSRCPRLVEAYFSGTDVRSITFANGSKIEKIQLSDATTVLELLNLSMLKNLEWGNLSKVEFFRIENCDVLDSFAKLKEIYNQDNTALTNIRLLGFEYNGVSQDVDLLANLATDKDKNGEPHDFRGIDSNGVPSEDLLPVLEGKMTLEGYAYEDSVNDVRSYFPNIDLTIGGLYVRFADPEVNRIMAEELGDGTGTPVETVESTETIPSFKGNTSVREFIEFSKFKNVTILKSQYFSSCSSLEKIAFPNNLITIDSLVFYQCKALNFDVANLPTSIEVIDQGAFEACAMVHGDLNLPNLRILQTSNNFCLTGLNRVLNLGKVTNIPLGAFASCASLQDINLSDLIESIGSSAFDNCTALNTDLTGKLLNVTAIGDGAFNNTQVSGELNLLNLQGKLGQKVFFNTNIESIKSLGNITSITENSGNLSGTFQNCANLTSMVLPESLEVIGISAFEGCTNLVYDIENLPKSLTTLGYQAFYNCQNIYGIVNLPNLTGNIQSGVFAKTNITKIENLGSITEIGAGGTSISPFNGTKLTEVILPDTIEKITQLNLFNGLDTLTKANVPEALKNVPAAMFRNCVNLVDLDIPGESSITSIAQSAFSSCLKWNFDITGKFENLTSIESGAFGGSTGIVGEVNMPNLQGTLYSYTFADTGITKIISLGGITSIVQIGNNISPFRGTKLTDVNLPDTITEITQGNLFSNIETLRNVNIPHNLKSLPAHMFYNCTGLTSIQIPETVTSIGISCFDGCSNLEIDLSNLSENITTLSVACFRNCSRAYGEINLPNLEDINSSGQYTLNSLFQGTSITKVKNLGKVTKLYFTFANCESLRFVELPETIIECGLACFQKCDSLRVLKLNSVAPPTFGRAFENMNTSNLKIYVPDDSVEAYKVASGWSTYADKIHPMSEYVEGEEDEVTE